jgi:UDP-glucuronate 4-epimerase
VPDGRSVVTGVAGFIGSHLAERLLDDGHEVVGVDAFTDYYPRTIKEANLAALRGRAGFTLVEADLAALDAGALLAGARYVFHQAGQAGVRRSWGDDFSVYLRDNVLATERLLEAAKGSASLRTFVFASSSSVYGDAERFPTPEDVMPRPASPYGVTKLACEHLCRVYHESFAVPAVALRYFTVYGPRQRPDMALHRFIVALLENREITVFGDGEQARDFTYVADTVEANVLAARACPAGEVINVGGGTPVSVNQAIATLERIVGRRARVVHADGAKGDAWRTSADGTRARRRLGFEPRVALEHGLRRHVEWLASTRTEVAR